MGARWAVVILLLVLGARRDAVAQSTKLNGYEAVPLTRGPQNHLVTPGSVNGRPASFLIDTGAESSFLQAERAQSFGVALTGMEARTGKRSFPVGVADELRLGGRNLGAARFSIYRAAQLGGPLPGLRGRAADGLIGRDVLQRHRAVINCRSRQLFLRSAAAPRLNLAAITRAQGFTAIPIEETRRGLTIPCSIAGRAGRLVLDTGAFLTGFDDDAARLLGLSGEPSAATARSFEGRVRPLQLVQVNDLKIGGVTIPPQKFVVTDLFTRKPLRTYTGLNRVEFYAPRQSARGDRILGLLGSELLDLHQAIIDLDSMTLFMK